MPPLVQFTRHGRDRFNRVRDRLRVAARAAASLALGMYRDPTPGRGVPGCWTAARAKSVAGGFRWPPTGHPTESDRMYFADVLMLPEMGRISNTGRVWRALYGNRAVLDRLLPMYYRRGWGSDSPRYQDELIRQDGPPIWRMVEYGTSPHEYGPRPDRQWMRFVWFRKDYQLTFAQRVRHPGAFRDQGALQRVGGRNPGLAVSAGMWPRRRRFLGMNTVGLISVEPWGAAPFRRSQMMVQTLGPELFGQALEIVGGLS